MKVLKSIAMAGCLLATVLPAAASATIVPFGVQFRIQQVSDSSPTQQGRATYGNPFGTMKIDTGTNAAMFTVAFKNAAFDFSSDLNGLLSPTCDVWCIALALDDALWTFDVPATAAQATMNFALTDPLPGVAIAETSALAPAAYAFRATGKVDLLPEPGTWATMLVGFAAIGAALRRRGGSVLARA